MNVGCAPRTSPIYNIITACPPMTRQPMARQPMIRPPMVRPPMDSKLQTVKYNKYYLEH